MSISLHIPIIDELWYREKLLGDKETMSYNKGYKLNFPEYDNETGCIAFPRDKWNQWFAWWIKCYPERYYAYIKNEHNNFVGEVNLHKDSENSYAAGIVIENRYRGQGYSDKALSLLLNIAFEELGADEVHNDFEKNRQAALRTHLKCGFKIVSEKENIVYLSIVKMDLQM